MGDYLSNSWYSLCVCVGGCVCVCVCVWAHYHNRPVKLQTLLWSLPYQLNHYCSRQLLGRTSGFEVNKWLILFVEQRQSQHGHSDVFQAREVCPFQIDSLGPVRYIYPKSLWTGLQVCCVLQPFLRKTREINYSFCSYVTYSGWNEGSDDSWRFQGSQKTYWILITKIRW